MECQSLLHFRIFTLGNCFATSGSRVRRVRSKVKKTSKSHITPVHTLFPLLWLEPAAVKIIFNRGENRGGGNKLACCSVCRSFPTDTDEEAKEDNKKEEQLAWHVTNSLLLVRLSLTHNVGFRLNASGQKKDAFIVCAGAKPAAAIHIFTPIANTEDTYIQCGTDIVHYYS